MEHIFYRNNPWWEDKGFTNNLIKRDSVLNKISENYSNKQVIFITGLRRIGKTTSIKLFIEHLITKKKIDKNRILYISLDNYMLRDYNILEIVEKFMQIQNIKFGEKLHLFFDEITYKPDFEIQLKNLYDNYNAKIVASSSSASMLKNRKDLLTGRNIIIEVLPLDFQEFLLFKKINISKADAHLVPNYFHEFLKTGGIPEYVLTNDIEYINNLVDNIIHKDIAALNNIRNVGVLKDYFLLLMERSGKQLSINKISNILKISPDTSRRYFDLFCDAFLIFPVVRYGKTNEKLLSPKKIYSVDLGIRNLFTGERDFGSLFENYIYIKIKHLKPRYYYENGIEIDFFTSNKQLIEVKYHDKNLNEKQKLLFDKIEAKSKHIIRTDYDIINFLNS